MNTIAELLVWAKGALASHSDTPKLDADVLLCFLLNKPRSYLLTWPERQLDAALCQQFQQLIAARCEGRPVAHLTGEREFWSLPLAVTTDTLIPRPDTEVLVERALALPLSDSARVMDLGTGTGAIALALASERPKWQVWGADRIPAALDLAKRNAKRLQLEQITWLLSDWFEKVPKQLQFDLIISNPPYIDNADPHLQQGDVRFEPHSALVAAEGGLADIKLICAQAHNYLAEGGWLLIEHGWQQADAVAALFDQAGFTKIELIKDMSGNPRSTLGCWQLTN